MIPACAGKSEVSGRAAPRQAGPPLDAGAEPSFVGVRSYAIDPERAARLWRLSAELTGIDALSATG